MDEYEVNGVADVECYLDWLSWLDDEGEVPSEELGGEDE